VGFVALRQNKPAFSGRLDWCDDGPLVAPLYAPLEVFRQEQVW
jgi:hypothetical protein